MTGHAGMPMTAKCQIIERDDARGTGLVELQDDGLLNVGLSFYLDEEALFKARQI